MAGVIAGFRDGMAAADAALNRRIADVSSRIAEATARASRDAAERSRTMQEAAATTREKMLALHESAAVAVGASTETIMIRSRDVGAIRAEQLGVMKELCASSDTAAERSGAALADASDKSPDPFPTANAPWRQRAYARSCTTTSTSACALKRSTNRDRIASAVERPSAQVAVGATTLTARAPAAARPVVGSNR